MSTILKLSREFKDELFELVLIDVLKAVKQWGVQIKHTKQLSVDYHWYDKLRV
jgi:hypothetical protein